MFLWQWKINGRPAAVVPFMIFVVIIFVIEREFVLPDCTVPIIFTATSCATP